MHSFTESFVSVKTMFLSRIHEAVPIIRVHNDSEFEHGNQRRAFDAASRNLSPFLLRKGKKKQQKPQKTRVAQVACGGENAYETFSTLCNLWLMGKVWREGKEQRRAEPEPERDRAV